jgi:RHS repeat-associated protein
MEWDFMERLCHVARGTTEAYYNYDGNGQRVRKVVEKGNITEERLYLGGFEIWRKRVNGNLDTERETLHIMDDKRRIAVAETKTVDNGMVIANPVPVQRYQLSNNIESVALELDENANIISYEEYYPYGETSYRAGRNIAEVGLKRYRYTSKEKDEESGLYYYGARYYACWLGRWTAADPAGLVDGLNLYMYCRGNSVRFIDCDGNASDDSLLLKPQIAKQDPSPKLGSNEPVEYADRMYMEINTSDDSLLLKPQIAKQDILKTPDSRFGIDKPVKYAGPMCIGVIDGKTVTLPANEFEFEKQKSYMNAQANALGNTVGSLSYAIASSFSDDIILISLF